MDKAEYKLIGLGLIFVVLTLVLFPGCATQVTKSPAASKPEVRALRNGY